LHKAMPTLIGAEYFLFAEAVPIQLVFHHRNQKSGGQLDLIKYPFQPQELILFFHLLPSLFIQILARSIAKQSMFYPQDYSQFSTCAMLFIEPALVNIFLFFKAK